MWGSVGKMAFERGVGYLDGLVSHVVKAKDKFHVTGKPTDLMSDVVQLVQPGGTIIDPFMGSGTTGVAAIQSGYEFIGVELSEEYFYIACERIGQTLYSKAA